MQADHVAKLLLIGCPPVEKRWVSNGRQEQELAEAVRVGRGGFGDEAALVGEVDVGLFADAGKIEARVVAMRAAAHRDVGRPCEPWRILQETAEAAEKTSADRYRVL